MEDLEKKKDKEPVKLVDMENEEINKTSSRLFDEAFISTNEEVQVRERNICCQSIHNVYHQKQNKALKTFYEAARLSEEKKLEVWDCIIHIIIVLEEQNC